MYRALSCGEFVDFGIKHKGYNNKLLNLNHLQIHRNLRVG